MYPNVETLNVPRKKKEEKNKQTCSGKAIWGLLVGIFQL